VVRISIEGENIHLEVLGADKFWAFKSQMTIPIAHVTKVTLDRDTTVSWLTSIRLLGTYVPGVITAGTFYEHRNLVFWDVHNADNTLRIELTHEQYAALYVEVEDPTESLELLNQAIGGRR
jgi:hypothetical protein